MNVRNISKSRLFLPDGTEIPPGESCKLTKDDQANAGVLEWFTDGWLVEEPSAPAKPKSATAETEPARD
jgi:hypothetical protein